MGWRDDPVVRPAGPSASALPSADTGGKWRNDPVVDTGSGPMGFLNRPIMGLFQGMQNIARAPTRPFLNEAAKRFEDENTITDVARSVGVEVAEPDETADTFGERAAEGVGLAAGMLVPGGVGVGMAARAPGMVGGAARTLADPFLRSPAASTAAEAGFGAASGAGGLLGERVALEIGADPSTGRTMGELLGGAAPLGAAVLGSGIARGASRAAEMAPVLGSLTRFGRAAVLPFTESGAKDIAGQRIRSLAGGDERARALADKIGDGSTVSGRTLAEQTEDPAIMALEREVFKADPDAWRAHDDNLKQATGRLREYLAEPAEGASPRDAQEFMASHRDHAREVISGRAQQAADKANAQVEAMRPEMKETDASSVYRREMEAALSDVRAREDEMWAAVPETATVPTENARGAFQQLRAGLGRAQQDDIPDEAARFLDAGAEGAFREAESAKEMHALYSKLRETARNARGGDNPNRNKARLADEMADAILADMDAAADVGGPLGAALAFTRQKHQTFSQGTVGELLGRKAHGGQAVPPETTLSRSAGRTGARGAVAVDDLMRAAGDRPEATAAMTDYMRRRFTDFAAPRGEFKPEKAQDFLRQNDELLDRFPELKREIAEAAESGQAASAARREADTELKGLDRAPESRFADAKQGREFEAILSENDPAAAARSVRQRAATDPAGKAPRGLESSAYDYVIRKSLGDQGFSAPKMRSLLADQRTRGALKETIGEDGIARLGRVLREVEMMERASRDLPNVGDAIITEGPNRAIRFLLGTLGARAGAQLGAGTSGASLRTASKTAGSVEGILDGLSANNAARMVRDALQDPDLFKALLLDMDVSANRNRVRQLVGPYMGAEAGQMFGGDTGEDEPLP